MVSIKIIYNMKKKVFKRLQKSANEKWVSVTSSSNAAEAVKKTMEILNEGGDPNYLFRNADGKVRGTILDLLPPSFVDARVHLIRHGALTLEAIKQIEEEGRLLAMKRAEELRKKQEVAQAAAEAYKKAVADLDAAEKERELACVLTEALASFK